MGILSIVKRFRGQTTPSNVIPFPTQRRAFSIDWQYYGWLCAEKLKRVLLFLWWYMIAMLRLVVYLILSRLRPVANMLFGPMITFGGIGFVIGIFYFPENLNFLMWILGGMSLAGMLLNHFYCWLILKLSPYDTEYF
jgi:hypothetical protein